MPIEPISNTNGISNIGINANQIQNIGVSGPSIIPTINSPVTKSVEVPVVRGMELPVILMPDTGIKYPVINVPTQAEFDAAVNAQKQQEQQPPQDKARGLPDPTPQLPQIVQTPPSQTTTPIAEVPADKPQPTFSVYGVDINLPDPSLVATAGAVAVVTTAATMASTAVLNVLKNAAEPLIREATKNKFKIKIKQVKPVLHYVMSDGGHVDIFEYSSEGTRLVAQTDNVEQYIRDQVDTNSLYEIENKVIIDDVMKDKFTKEGQERFKSLYTPPKKIAKKLSARLSF
jgi:hypothetical protein